MSLLWAGPRPESLLKCLDYIRSSRIVPDQVRQRKYRGPEEPGIWVVTSYGCNLPPNTPPPILQFENKVQKNLGATAMQNVWRGQHYVTLKSVDSTGDKNMINIGTSLVELKEY